MTRANTPEQMVEIHAASAGMLLDTQAAVDEALELAALTVAEADGKTAAINTAKRVALARGLLRHAPLASYIYGDAMKDGKPTRAGLVRVFADYPKVSP